MKSWQIVILCLSLVLLVPVLFWVTYTLWAFSPRAALTLEFTALATLVLAWFIFFDRTISHA